MADYTSTFEYASGDADTRQFIQEQHDALGTDQEKQDMVKGLTPLSHIESDPEYRFLHSKEYAGMDKPTQEYSLQELHRLPTLKEKQDFANQFQYQQPGWFARTAANVASYLPPINAGGTPQ